MKKWKNILDFALCVILMFMVPICICNGILVDLPTAAVLLLFDVMLWISFLQYNIRKYPIYGYLENSMFPNRYCR